MTQGTFESWLVVSFWHCYRRRCVMENICIVVHGGAWAIPDDAVKASAEGCRRAAMAGYAVLSSGGSALDAVQVAVRVLEDDPVFDAGTGSVLNEAGEVEMDAVIMDGKTLNSGAVAAICNVRNPVDVARLVMEKSPHALFVGPGANLFAKAQGVPTVPQESLVTEQAREEWKRYQQYKTTVDVLFNHAESNGGKSGHDTVGAVAVDKLGHVAASTSTGGITAKAVGRVGDAPLVGSGVYADDNSAGISCTGHGESIIRTALAGRVAIAVEQGATPQDAIHKGLQLMRARIGGCGGVIAVRPNGDFGLECTTVRMAYAVVTARKPGEVVFGVDPSNDAVLQQWLKTR